MFHKNVSIFETGECLCTLWTENTGPSVHWWIRFRFYF